MPEAKSEALNRRDAMKLISAVAALGAGLSVCVQPAGAAETEKVQFSIKLYKEKGTDDDLIHSIDIPMDAAQKLLKYDTLQVKLFKDSKAVMAGGKLVTVAQKIIAPK